MNRLLPPLAALIAAGSLASLVVATADESSPPGPPLPENFLLDDPLDARDTASTWYRNNVATEDPYAISSPQENARIRLLRKVADTGSSKRRASRR